MTPIKMAIVSDPRTAKSVRLSCFPEESVDCCLGMGVGAGAGAGAAAEAILTVVRLDG